ncbi:hypothetical protein D3P96_07755 [Weissella viridescens]|uniref:Uncharacterized protein n=1 Tax=Weissella viridescens TaxID=1629 RepID=A0A3P2R9F3_WEIVI|nr:hypothetical protein [Weissella viridescens]RRG17439.1 hypothetical protein D3P96_07755 [Weissella viridescens]
MDTYNLGINPDSRLFLTKSITKIVGNIPVTSDKVQLLTFKNESGNYYAEFVIINDWIKLKTCYGDTGEILLQLAN